jgi:hypothetical protein
MTERFFRTTALAEDLHFVDLRDWDPWEPSRLQYRDEAEVRWLVRAGAGERRIIRTAAELGAAIDDSDLRAAFTSTSMKACSRRLARGGRA